MQNPVGETVPVRFGRAAWSRQDRLARVLGYRMGRSDITPPHARAPPRVLLLSDRGVPKVTIASVTDGTSNTIMVGETIPAQTADSNFWDHNGACFGTTVPINWTTFRPGLQRRPALLVPPTSSAGYSYSSKGAKSKHPGGANFCFGDGSVRFLKNSINLQTYCAIGSRNGGEVVQLRRRIDRLTSIPKEARPLATSAVARPSFCLLTGPAFLAAGQLLIEDITAHVH